MTVPSVLSAFYDPNWDGKRVWNVRAITVPDSYGELFTDEGPTIYLEPIAYLCVRIERSGIFTYTSWVPMTQAEMAIVRPNATQATSSQLMGTAMPGVTIDADVLQF